MEWGGREMFIAVSHVRAVNTLREIVADHAQQEEMPRSHLLESALLAPEDFLHLAVQRIVPHVRQALIQITERQSA